MHQTLLVLTTVMHVGQSGSQMKKCFICGEKVVKCLTFAQCLTCWLGKCLCVIIHTWACLAFLQCFHIWFLHYFPHHFCVYCPILCWCLLLLFVFPLMSCIPFVSLYTSGIILLFGLSFVMFLVVEGDGCLLIWSRMASSGSVFVCLFTWLCRKFPAVIGVGPMCCLLHVIILPVLMTCILYDLLWWLWLPLSTTVPWVHGPPSSHWTATVDPIGIDVKIFEVSLPQSFIPCLCIKVWWCSSSLSMLIGGLSITGIMPLTRQLNSSIAGLGRPCPSGLVLICSIVMCISPPESVHLFIVHLMNLMQASTCLLLWWWYDEVTACSMLRLLQKFCGVCHIPQIWLWLLQFDYLLITHPFFYYPELAMVINNAHIISVIKLEHICTSYIPWSYWDVMVYVFFSLGCICWN